MTYNLKESIVLVEYACDVMLGGNRHLAHISFINELRCGLL